MIKILVIFLCFLFPLYAHEDEKDKEDDKPLKIGNLSLPPSQQPGPLVGFGENVIDKGQKQFFLMGNFASGRDMYFSTLIPGFNYGITDNLSIFFNVPFSPENKFESHHSSGLNDIFVQLEYAYYNDQNLVSSSQGTLLGYLALPTGSVHKNPSTGLGAPSFFLGTTYNHEEFDWVYFGSTGILIPTSHNGTRFGDLFLYQAGIGRNICTPPGWIFDIILELTGQYAWRDQILGIKNPDSGGNLIVLTPSLWLSSAQFIYQLGVGFPIVQDLFGMQSKQTYFITFNFGYTF